MEENAYEQHEDRRVRRTKKALLEALAEIMIKKDLRNITVRELADKADVHRATFYAHYCDVYDLYEQMEDMIVNELVAIVDDVSLSDKKFFEALIEYIYSNSKICRMFLDKNSNRSFVDRVSSILETKYIEIWKQDLGKQTLPEAWYYGATYHIKGCLSLISRWAEHHFAFPKEQIVDTILKVDTNFDNFLMQWPPQ